MHREAVSNAYTWPGAGVWPYLARLAALLCGGVLLYSVYGKGMDPEAFVARIENLEFFPSALAKVTAYGVLAAEALLGMLLVLNVRTLRNLIPTLLMVVVFMGLTGYEWWRVESGAADPLAGCGCFGKVVDRTPGEALWMDGLLLVLPLLIAFLSRPLLHAFFKPRLALATAALVGTLVFSLMAPDLPLDDYATRLSPGKKVAELCVGPEGERECLSGTGGQMPEIEEGKHLVILSNLDEAEMLAAVGRMNAYHRAWSEDGGTGPELWVITPKSGAALNVFQAGDPDTNRPPVTFTSLEKFPAVLAPLYRRLPRSFLVEDGVVTETWSGLPSVLPDAADAVPAAEDTALDNSGQGFQLPPPVEPAGGAGAGTGAGDFQLPPPVEPADPPSK